MTLLSGSGILLPPVALNVAVTMATTPLLITALFIPLATQLTDPATDEQLSDLPAALRAGPAAILRLRIPLVAYRMVHCNAEGVLTEEGFSVRFNETDPV